LTIDQFRAVLDLGRDGDGRTLGLRRAVVYQDTQQLGERRIVATGAILVDRADDGYDYQFNGVAHADPLAAKPIDFPVVPGETRLISDTGLDDASAAPAELAFWMRCGDFTDTLLARPVLAYVSDWPVVPPSVRRVGVAAGGGSR
jgi:acyl-CoA thioesterase-2